MKRPYLCVSALQSESDAAAAIQGFLDSGLLRSATATCPLMHRPCLGFAVDETNLSVGRAPSPRKVDSFKVIRTVAEANAAEDLEIALHVDLRSPGNPTPEGDTVAELSTYFIRPQGVVSAIFAELRLRAPLLQLNGVIAESDLAEVKALECAPRIILPIGEPLMALPEGVLGKYLSSVSSFVDYLLFDCSGGLGKAFKLGAFKRFAQASRTYAPTCALGLSGGLSPENIQAHLAQLRSDTKLQELAPVESLSFDVESGIRSTTSDGQDRVDHTKLTAFIQSAVRALTPVA